MRSCSASTSATATSPPCRAASACASPWTRDTRPSSPNPRRSCDASSRSAGSAASWRTGVDGGALGYHGHLSCLFPQHGPGKKHERPIELEPWQYGLVGAAPWAFVRGCIRSDGCSFVNRTGRYAYLSHEFRNWSTDSLGIFASTCATVGLHPRPYRDRVRLRRRADVAQRMTHVGIKS